MQRNFFGLNTEVTTIYFGGGTPSVLSQQELTEILNAVYKNFVVAKSAELTFECNPDDLDKTYLQELKKLGINRLSIGIQSYNDQILQWMNRSHNSKQALESVYFAAETGFNDITVDLIYGVPQLVPKEWEDTVNKTLLLPINHLSSYSLTLEENTPYNKLVKQGKYIKPDNDLAADHYQTLVTLVKEQGWEHYEVSNFCKEGIYAVHNTAYWQRQPYLGIGPSAHGFKENKRFWNVSNNKAYIQSIVKTKLPQEIEVLKSNNELNEVLLTGLRTKWGVNLSELKQKFGWDPPNHLITEWQEKGWLKLDGSQLLVTEEGMLFSDYISTELFMV